MVDALIWLSIERISQLEKITVKYWSGPTVTIPTYTSPKFLPEDYDLWEEDEEDKDPIDETPIEELITVPLEPSKRITTTIRSDDEDIHLL